MSKTSRQETGKVLNVTVNGEARTMKEGATIQSLLEEIGLSAGKVAVERNRAIAPRSSYGETCLADGDSLEIVRFVGGG